MAQGPGGRKKVADHAIRPILEYRVVGVAEVEGRPKAGKRPDCKILSITCQPYSDG